MNQKKAKAMRQSLRMHGHDPKDAKYRGQATLQKAFQSGVDVEGSPKKCLFNYEGTRHLSPNCGRAVYKAAKLLGLNPFMEGA